jgi:kynurenine formamidase
MPATGSLEEERGVTASGHETTDTDPAVSVTKGDYALESYVLRTNHYQIEMLANLDLVPEAGAIVIVVSRNPDMDQDFLRA